MSRLHHLNDNELLLAADVELPVSRAAETQSHLAACKFCRHRLAALQTALRNVSACQRESFGPELPPIAVSRAALRARLTEIAKTRRRSDAWWAFLQAPPVVHAAAVLCGMLLLAAATHTLVFTAPASMVGTATYLESGVIPNHSLTPGAFRNASLAEVCKMPHEEVELDVPSALGQQVFQEYKIANPRTSDYEIDYLVAPGLGGTDDIRNLWPEPYGSATWNARVKDSLEEYLHESVCSGKIDLRTAQFDISTNWIAAYKKYFHTNDPAASSAEMSRSMHDQDILNVPTASRLSAM